MPAKNAAAFIKEAIESLLKVTLYEWELIVVNDHSTDATADILEKYAQEDPRVRVYQNTGNGKVTGLNYGYSLSKGDIIKCIDADDVLLPEFFEVSNLMDDHDALCHDSYVVNSKLKRIGTYYINAAYLKNDYETVLANLISLPRWTWSFSREIGGKIFPLPDDLPFEDVWFALVIKHHASSIEYSREKLYLYRQHKNQTFGGILNYDKAIINFRARRMIKLIRALASNADRIELTDISELDYIERYNLLLVDQFKFRKILSSKLQFVHKLKVTLMCFFPSLASTITILKWRWDQVINK